MQYAPSSGILGLTFLKNFIQPLEKTFLEKALYFIDVLTKRNNLSHSEAIFICRFHQNMEVGVAGHTFFEKSNEVNFLNSRAIISFHTKSRVIVQTFELTNLKFGLYYPLTIYILIYNKCPLSYLVQ